MPKIKLHRKNYFLLSVKNTDNLHFVIQNIIHSAISGRNPNENCFFLLVYFREHVLKLIHKVKFLNLYIYPLYSVMGTTAL